MAESRTGPKFGHPTLFLFLVYFSFTSLFLLDLHDAFTTCSITNTTVTSDTADVHSIPFNLARAGTSKRKPILVPSLVVSTHAIPNFLRMFHLCFHHFNNQSNTITIVPILEMRMWMTCYLCLYQRSTATAFDKLSYSYRASIAKYFDLVVTIEIYIHLLAEHCFIFCAHMRRYCSSQQGKLLAGASARGLGGFGQDLRSIWQPNSRLGRRSACACAEADFWETSGTT